MTLLLLALLACRAPIFPLDPGPAPAPALAPGQVVLAHTNDLHAHFLPDPAPWLEGSPRIGGMEAISGHLRALRAAHGEALYLDGGDVLTGTPLMEFPAHGAKGGAMLDFLAALECDGFVLGNHEFDLGVDNLRAFVESSAVPVLSANIRDPGTGDLLFANQKQRMVLDYNGMRLGVFGLTTAGLSRLILPSIAARVDALDAAAVARAQVKALEEEGVDLVIAVTHVGIEVDRELAAAVPGIDLIVGGHSHTALVPAERVGETWIVQAGSYGRQLGVSRFTVQDGQIVGFSDTLLDLLPEQVPAPPSAAIVELTEEWKEKIDERFSRVVGQADAPLLRAPEGTGDGGDSTMGRWAAEVMRIAALADVGVYNTGGLRADLAAGPVTVGDLYEIFPFSNEVVRFTWTGEELLTAILRSAQGELHERPRSLQWSGVRFTWRVRLDMPEIVEVYVGDQPLDLARAYTIATNSYVAEQWESNLGARPRDPGSVGITALEAAIAAAEAGPIRPPLAPRSVRLDP